MFFQHCVTHFNCNPSRNLFEARNQCRIVEQSIGLPDVCSFLDCYFQLPPTVYLSPSFLAVARERCPPDVWQVGSEGCSRALCSEFASCCVLRNTLEWFWCWEWGVGMWKPWGFCRITPNLPGMAEGSGQAVVPSQGVFPEQEFCVSDGAGAMLCSSL